MSRLSVESLIAGRDDPFVVVDRQPARFIIINRPNSRNALTRQMRRELPAILAAADDERTVATVVLTGAGSAFCAGVDLKERAINGPAPLIKPNPAECLRTMRKPVIAAVNGACTTGALEIALSCSFSIASKSARFADTHAKVGLMPRWGQPSLLIRAVGIHRARQLMLTSEFLDAHTAMAWGLVNEVTAPHQLLNRCLDISTAIAAADAKCVKLLQHAFGASNEAIQHE